MATTVVTVAINVIFPKYTKALCEEIPLRNTPRIRARKWRSGSISPNARNAAGILSTGEA